MSDPLCVGVCMIDWQSGVCVGCGRTQEEIDAAAETPAADVPGAGPEVTQVPDGAAGEREPDGR